MRTFNADEMLRLIHRIRELNQTPLDQIEWVNDKGEKIVVEEKTMKEWNFVGLNNKDFVECVLFGDFKEDCRNFGPLQ